MSDQFLGLLIESLVAVLLVLTIGYCMVLNHRLKRLRADESSLRATIAELVTSTQVAQSAIDGLKITVRECDATLGERLRAALTACHDPAILSPFARSGFIPATNADYAPVEQVAQQTELLD